MERFRRHYRLAIGILIAPGVPGILLGLGDHFAASRVGWFWYFAITSVIAYPVALAAYAVYFFVLLAPRVSMSITAVIGGSLGTVGYLLNLLMGFPVETSLGLFFLCLCGGLISGICFWTIARPDRD